MTPFMNEASRRRTNPCHAPWHWQRSKDSLNMWPPGGMAAVLHIKKRLTSFASQKRWKACETMARIPIIPCEGQGKLR